MFRKIPLAWLQLTREKTRFAVALAGIAFADILIFMQIGFREGLFNSNVQLHKSLDGDIVLINRRSQVSITLKTFSQRRLYQALAFDSVKSVHPIYLSFTIWKNPQTGQLRNIQVIGFNPEQNVLNLPGVEENLRHLKMPNVVLFDKGSRPEFGSISTDFNKGKPIKTELESRQIQVGGIFELGASFGADGNLITSDLNFLRIFQSKPKRGLIDIGLIKLKPGANSESVANQLSNFFCKEVRGLSRAEKNVPRKNRYECKNVEVLTKQEFIDLEKAYWTSSTGIGFIFTLGTVMGFVVGTVIVYQILYSEVSDHLSEYATLKAMGYTQRYLLLVVFTEALILSIIGYLPGLTFAMFQYKMARDATLLPILMTSNRAVSVLIMTILMCFISGAIAVRKLEAVEPADIF